VQVSHIFSSDLQRAFKTAEAIRLAQPETSKNVTQLSLLREQDFGYYEGKRFNERPKTGDRSWREAHHEAHMNTEDFQDVESKPAMIARVETFLDGHLVPHLGRLGELEAVAVVAHGIILTYLWRGVLARFETENVSVATGLMASGNGMGLDYLGGWSNTGYLDLEIKSKVLPHQNLPCAGVEPAGPLEHSKALFPTATLPPDTKPTLIENVRPAAVARPSPSLEHSADVAYLPATQQIPEPTSLPHIQTAVLGSAIHPVTPVPLKKLPNLSLVVKAVNSQEHLKGLKKTRGGIGSSKHDEKQKTMDSFFKRQKLG
jgi:hypothetical protein